MAVTALVPADDGTARALRERGVSVIRGDLAAPGPWQQAAADAGVIVHAGLPQLEPPVRGRQITHLAREAAEGARNLRGAIDAGADVVTASLWIGDADGPLQISSPALAAEDALAGDRTRAVRMPWPYGPAGFLRDVARGLLMRRVRIVGSGGNHIALVGARDAAAALASAADAPPGRYAVSEHDPPTQVGLVHHLCAGIGAPRPDHLPPRLASFTMGGVIVEALVADQRVPGPPPPGFAATQEWRRDLQDALRS